MAQCVLLRVVLGCLQLVDFSKLDGYSLYEGLELPRHRIEKRCGRNFHENEAVQSASLKRGELNEEVSNHRRPASIQLAADSIANQEGLQNRMFLQSHVLALAIPNEYEALNNSWLRKKKL